MKNNVSFNSALTKFGIGLFETIKILNNPIDLEEHLNRMYNSIYVLDIKFDVEKDKLRENILDYIKENNIKNKALRITIFDQGYNLSTREIVYTDDVYEKGVSLTISQTIRGNSILYKHKTTNYFENILTKENALKEGYFDGIFLNSNNEILETSMSNIYFIKNNTVITPKSNQPLLNGIMRNKVNNICNKIGIDYIEDNIKLADIDKFDYCFISNSLMGIMKVTNIQNIYYNKINNIFTKIFNELSIMEKENE